MIDRDALALAIDTSGLTLTEVADRAGVDPAQFGHLRLQLMPVAVLARLADVVGLPLHRLLGRGGPHQADEDCDCSVVGAYLAEFREGLTRDQLSEVLGWNLSRLERALASLDETLRPGGMRLALSAGRIVVVGRLERTEYPSRVSLERLTDRFDLDSNFAAFIWEAMAGIPPERIPDPETLRVANRRGLVMGWQGRLRVSEAVEFSLCLNGYHH